MSYTKIKTYVVRPKDKSKCYFEDTEIDNALGYLKSSAFVNASDEANRKAFLQHSYEHEIHLFAERLTNGMSAVYDDDGQIEQYVFEDKERFDERHLLWACFDLIIKADLTISTLKRARMELLQQNVKKTCK